MPKENEKRLRARRPDDISDEFPDGSIKLFAKILGPTVDGEAARVWIEGDRLSLEYLGKMILAQAAFPLDCHYGISPRTAGSAFFKRGAKVGIVIHRLPCMSPEIKGSKNSRTGKGRKKQGPPEQSTRASEGAQKRRIPGVGIGMHMLGSSAVFHSGRVRVRIGHPIPTEGLALRDRRALTEVAHQQIAGMLGTGPEVNPRR